MLTLWSSRKLLVALVTTLRRSAISAPPHLPLMTSSVLATFNRSGVTRYRRLLDTRYLLSTASVEAGS